MADNTLLNAGSGGDTVRDVAKTANSPAKTQIVIVDIGGGLDASSEVAWTGAPPVGYASLAVNQASITATASSIVSARTGAPGTGRGSVQFFNIGSNDADLGGSGVTFGTGFRLLAGEKSDPMPSTAAWYGICNTALSTTIAYVELY